MDLVKKSSLMVEIERIYTKHYSKSTSKGYRDFYNAVYNAIKKSPTIDAQPVVHGEWESKRCNHKPYRIKNPEAWCVYICSACGYSNGRKKSNYCPYCGARMDLKEGE